MFVDSIRPAVWGGSAGPLARGKSGADAYRAGPAGRTTAREGSDASEKNYFPSVRTPVGRWVLGVALLTAGFGSPPANASSRPGSLTIKYAGGTGHLSTAPGVAVGGVQPRPPARAPLTGANEPENSRGVAGHDPAEVCGLPESIFQAHEQQAEDHRTERIGRVFGQGVYLRAPAGRNQLETPGAPGTDREELAVESLAALFRTYVHHYAPLGRFNGNGSRRHLRVYCRYTRKLGGNLPERVMRGTAAYDAKFFLPVLIRWYRKHPSEAGRAWAPPPPWPPLPRAAPTLSPMDARDMRLFEKSAPLVRALRTEYPSLGAVQQALWLDRTQPPEVATFCFRGFAAMRCVAAARRILQLRPEISRASPKLTRLSTIMAANHSRKELERAVTGLARRGQIVIYTTILRDLRDHVISLGNKRIRGQLVAAATGRLQQLRGVSASAVEISGHDRARQPTNNPSQANWFLMGTIVAGDLLITFIAMVWIGCALTPATKEDPLTLTDKAKAHAISIFAAFATLAGWGLLGFVFTVHGGPGADRYKVGAIATGIGLLLSGFVWGRLAINVSERRLRRMLQAAEALASEVAATRKRVEGILSREIGK